MKTAEGAKKRVEELISIVNLSACPYVDRQCSNFCMAFIKPEIRHLKSKTVDVNEFTVSQCGCKRLED